MATSKSETHKMGVSEDHFLVDVTEHDDGRVHIVVRVPGHAPIHDQRSYETTGLALEASQLIADSQRLPKKE